MSYQIWKETAHGDVYRRIYMKLDGEVVIAEMQRHDEMDYDQTRFLTAVRFPTDDDAKNFIRERLTDFADEIDPALRSKLLTIVETTRQDGWKHCLD